MSVPKSVGEHDVRSAVWTVFIRSVEEAAEKWLQAQYVEVVPARENDPDSGWIFASVQPYLSGVIRCQTIKTFVAIPQVEIVGIGLIRRSLVTMLDCVEALGLRPMRAGKANGRRHP